MAKKLSKIQKLMDEKPALFNYSDIPPDRVLNPEQEAYYEAAYRKWAKTVWSGLAANEVKEARTVEVRKASTVEDSEAGVHVVEFDDIQPNLPGF